MQADDLGPSAAACGVTNGEVAALRSCRRGLSSSQAKMSGRQESGQQVLRKLGKHALVAGVCRGSPCRFPEVMSEVGHLLPAGQVSRLVTDSGCTNLRDRRTGRPEWSSVFQHGPRNPKLVNHGLPPGRSTRAASLQAWESYDSRTRRLGHLWRRLHSVCVQRSETDIMAANKLPTEDEQPLLIELGQVGTVSPLSKQVREKWDSADADTGRDHSLESLLARLTAADEKRQVSRLVGPLRVTVPSLLKCGMSQELRTHFLMPLARP